MQERAYLYNVRVGVYMPIYIYDMYFYAFFLSFDDRTPENSTPAGRNGFSRSDWMARLGRAATVALSDVRPV